MPHIPRRLAPTRGTPPEFQDQGKNQSRIEVPPDPGDLLKAERKHLGLTKINPRTHEVKPATIYKNLFGKEPEIDDHTGELVHAR